MNAKLFFFMSCLVCNLVCMEEGIRPTYKRQIDKIDGQITKQRRIEDQANVKEKNIYDIYNKYQSTKDKEAYLSQLQKENSKKFRDRLIRLAQISEGIFKDYKPDKENAIFLYSIIEKDTNTKFQELAKNKLKKLAE